MGVYIDMAMATVVTVFVVDLSGFTQSWKNMLGRWLHVNPYNLALKPFDCSLCMTWWVCLAVALIEGSLSLGAVTAAALLAFAADWIGSALRMVKDIMVKLIDWIYNKLKI